MRKMCVTALLGTLLICTPSSANQSDQPTTVIASYYQYGSRTANGERYNPDGFTAAHRTLPFGTLVHVTNTKNGKTVVVRVNDRGPFIKSRTIDVSRGAARVLDMIKTGTARVEMRVV